MMAGTHDRALVIGRVGPSPARDSGRISPAGATRVARVERPVAERETAAAGVYFREVKAGTVVRREGLVMLR